MRLVLDTDVVVSAFFWTGAPSRLMRIAATGEVQIFTSAPMLVELRKTIYKEKFGEKVTASPISMDGLMKSYIALASLVVPAEVPRLVADADDDVVIGTAVAARADYAVTGDRALLLVANYQDVLIASVIDTLSIFARS